MPLTAYLKIDDIPGESQRVGHEDEIDVYALSWKIDQSRPASLGRGRFRARTDVGPLVVQKYYDASSPYLADAVEEGKSFDEVVLAVRKDSGEAHLDYLVITMTNAVISSYAVTTKEDDLQLSETLEIDFEKVNIKYVVQADDHSAGDEHEVEIDTFTRR